MLLLYIPHSRGLKEKSMLSMILGVMVALFGVGVYFVGFMFQNQNLVPPLGVYIFIEMLMGIGLGGCLAAMLMNIRRNNQRRRAEEACSTASANKDDRGCDSEERVTPGPFNPYPSNTPIQLPASFPIPSDDVDWPEPHQETPSRWPGAEQRSDGEVATSLGNANDIMEAIRKQRQTADKDEEIEVTPEGPPRRDPTS